MAAEASDENVGQLVDISGCSRETAQRYLKAKNNDLMAAVNAVLDNEDISQAEAGIRWSENDFSADREGNAAYGPEPAYDDGNSSLHPLGISAAPTRGSSPVPSHKAPSTRAEEDAEMEQALANSRHDFGHGRLQAHQDVGIVASAGGAFGPATKDDYDPSKWAMTVPRGHDSHEAREIVPDLEPADRQNQPGEPRFIKHLTSGDYLSSLLTISHSIPLARHLLLAPHSVRPSYGQDADWWKGHTIRLPRIVSTVDLSLAEPAPKNDDEVLAEMQRLMALLDASSRSYGSADALVRAATSHDTDVDTPTDALLDRVLQAWELTSRTLSPDHDGHVGLFHSIIGTNSPEGLNTPNMWSLPLPVDAVAGQTVTLAEVMDAALWDTDPDESAFCDNYMERCADVLPIRVTQSDVSRQTLGIIIPASFHVDKYLLENVESTRSIRMDMAQSKRKIEKIDATQDKLKTLKHPRKPSSINASGLMEYVIGHFSGENKRAMLQEREMSGADANFVLPPQPAGHDSIAERLTAVCRSIDAKLEALEVEKEKARQMLTQLSLATPPGLSEDNLKYRYTLRGVSTKPSVTYILRPRPDDAMESDAMTVDEEAPEGMEWWRIEYDVNVHGSRVLKTRSTQDDVIRAAELEHNQALLVYASERAVSAHNNLELPEPLKEFIRDDDELFWSDLQTTGSYGHVGIHTPPEHDRPRLSIESTTVNLDDDTEPPPYEHDEMPVEIDHGKGRAAATEIYLNGESPPAHEITLDDATGEDSEGLEMVEKAHVPFLNPTQVHHSGANDIAMTGSAPTQYSELDGRNNLD
ncbi:hypothetical protein MBLNU459_g5443t1 [Dothideomycetes sp. NU459]